MVGDPVEEPFAFRVKPLVQAELLDRLQYAAAFALHVALAIFLLRLPFGAGLRRDGGDLRL
eukprot:7231165-Lingulodinium_polyedra.AAC.1